MEILRNILWKQNIFLTLPPGRDEVAKDAAPYHTKLPRDVIIAGGFLNVNT